MNYVENILCLKGLNTPPLPVFYQMIKNETNKQTKKNVLYFEKFQLILAPGALMLSVGAEVTNEPLPEGDDRLEFMKT